MRMHVHVHEHRHVLIRILMPILILTLMLILMVVVVLMLMTMLVPTPMAVRMLTRTLQVHTRRVLWSAGRTLRHRSATAACRRVKPGRRQGGHAVWRRHGWREDICGV